MAGNSVRIGVGVILKGEKDLDKLRDKFDRLTKMGAKGFAIGVGAAVTTQAFNLMGMAVNKIGDVLGDATEAALAEEESIAKLGTSLRANVPAWDGNTAAIGKVLTARMKLGFSDDEQRNSLALLVVATHDATKALEVQRVAMDLARFKGISLADATEALTKVEAGSYRILKSLGIALKDGATAQEALTAVQKAAAGQAEDYANTNRGKLLVSQTKVGEAMEKFGAVTMPIVVDVMGGAADAATGLAGVVDVLTNKEHDAADAAEKWAAANHTLKFGFPTLEDFAPKVDKVGDAIEILGGHTHRLTRAFNTADSVMADKIVPDLKDIKKASNDATGAVDDLTEALFGPQEVSDSLVEAKLRVQELQKTIRESHDKADVAQAKRDLHDVNAEIFKLSFEQAKLKGPSALAEWFKGAQKAAEKAGPSALAYLAALRSIATVTGKLPAVMFTASGKKMLTGPPHAAGGPVSAGTAYPVGEKGPELFVPKTSGDIIPNNRLGSGGGTTLNLTVNVAPSLGMTPAAARGIGDAVGPAIYDYLHRRGAI